MRPAGVEPARSVRNSSPSSWRVCLFRHGRMVRGTESRSDISFPRLIVTGSVFFFRRRTNGDHFGVIGGDNRA